MKVLFRAIDLETTGLAPPAEVVEIGWTDLEFDTESRECSVGVPHSRLFCPTQPMPSDVVAVHHLTADMLAGLHDCTDQDLVRVATEPGVMGQNPSFLAAAYSAFEEQWVFTPDGVRWLCTVKAAARIYPDAPSASNQAMRYELGLDLDPALAMPPHRAGPDSYVTAHVLARFLKTERVSHLAAWTLEPRWMARCPLWRGVPWADVDHGFLTWMLRTPDLDADAVHWARLELQRRSEIT